VGFWNRGKESIRPEHVLEPVFLETAPRVPILEAKVYYLSRRFIDLMLDRSHFSEGRVGLTWKILEHDDAAVIQLIVVGPVTESISASGSLEGQKFVRQVAGSDLPGRLSVWQWSKSSNFYLASQRRKNDFPKFHFLRNGKSGTRLGNQGRWKGRGEVNLFAAFSTLFLVGPGLQELVTGVFRNPVPFASQTL